MSERRDKNVTSVIDQLRDREQAGLNKYGTNTERTDLDTLEWLQHLQEELMDGAVYIERLKGDVKELLRLSTEPMGSKEFDEMRHTDTPRPKRTSVMNNHNTFYGTDEDKEEEYKELPRFATDEEAGFTPVQPQPPQVFYSMTGVEDGEGRRERLEKEEEEKKYDFSEQKYSTPQHVKIPTDD